MRNNTDWLDGAVCIQPEEATVPTPAARDQAGRSAVVVAEHAVQQLVAEGRRRLIVDFGDGLKMIAADGSESRELGVRDAACAFAREPGLLYCVEEIAGPSRSRPEDTSPSPISRIRTATAAAVPAPQTRPSVSLLSSLLPVRENTLNQRCRSGGASARHTGAEPAPPPVVRKR